MSRPSCWYKLETDRQHSWAVAQHYVYLTDFAIVADTFFLFLGYFYLPEKKQWFKKYLFLLYISQNVPALW